MEDYGNVIATDTVRLERVLPGPIERVWSYLVESDKRAQWLASGEIEPRVGGSVKHVFHNAKLTGHDDPPPPELAAYGGEHVMLGRVTAYEPPRLLAYTWTSHSTGGPSEVRFELTAQGNKVHLLLTHTRLPGRDAMVSVSGGWHAHLGVLADRLDQREPASFWPAFARLRDEYERRIPRP
ncbi:MULTISPECIES: SRPBCC family protein [Ralstonia solanacearum species complex]|uniref:ATPase n=1 Tax=Ralstonia syzygii TaxID=28097 RepID=A0ABX7ZNS0_9RALS|nr:MULTISPECIES: SRPBCC family protein [Ralstonia solanacearum species complex]AXV79778.1 ATPase [Ralstonia solanacearum]AXV93806.1 ATPase [Ralstonia solanacearum]AXW21798.1 ATPase [Ralstonia solanacearum]AXW78700.1 ATPase [Ralstonia solanacearum]QUP57015.1 ATPase [Ralstonia syzygii]